MVMDILTSKEREAQKTSAERADDVAYVFNHALSCAITDTFIQPPTGAFVQKHIERNTWPKWLRWLGKIFEPHGHEHPHSHEHHSGFRKNLGHWVLGEAVGDLGAVPLTILVQRTMPGLTNILRKMLEPVVGWRFKKSAVRDARRWAGNHGFNPEGPEAKAHAETLYEHEISHLPLAAIWNAFSIPLNLATQKVTGNKANLGTLLLGKIFGALVSNGMLIGGRALEPEIFHKLDRFNSKKIIQPVDKALGIEIHETVAEHQERDMPMQGRTWASRQQNPQTERIQL